MIRSALIAAGALVVAVAVFMPRPEGGPASPTLTGADQGGGSAGPWATNRVAVAGSTRSAVSGWSGGLTLERASDGHFYANPTINSRELHVLVDTGASVVALTGEDARAIGLDWDDAEIRPIARGASGDVHGVPATIDRMQLGGLEAHDVAAIIVPEGLDITLLGQSFLHQVGRVEISGDAMTLED